MKRLDYGVYGPKEMNWTVWTPSSFILYSPCKATELRFQFSSVQFISVALYAP